MYRETTTPAASFQPNRWGLYDMHGNVWEWCAGWYGDYPAGAASDPTGPQQGGSRVLRGGSWGGFGQGCRCAYRYWNAPGDRINLIGFRVVLDSY